MLTAGNVLATLLAATFAVHGAMMILAVPVMRAGAASVGLSVTHYRYIGLLELAAAAGLVAGFEVPAFGIAASTGLVALMIAAILVHYRSGDPFTRMIPALVLGSMAAAYIAVIVSQL